MQYQETARFADVYLPGGEGVRQAGVRDDLSLSTNSLFFKHFVS